MLGCRKSVVRDAAADGHSDSRIASDTALTDSLATDVSAPWDHPCLPSCGLAETMRVAGTCRYLIHCPPEGDSSAITVVVGGQEIAWDTTRSAGWDYTDSTMSAIDLYGQACQDLLAGRVTMVSVVYRCANR